MSRYATRVGINRAYSSSLVDKFIARNQPKPKRSMLEGTIRIAVTRVHTSTDNGKKFFDNFGREYTYTVNGLIY